MKIRSSKRWDVFKTSISDEDEEFKKVRCMLNFNFEWRWGVQKDEMCVQLQYQIKTWRKEMFGELQYQMESSKRWYLCSTSILVKMRTSKSWEIYATSMLKFNIRWRREVQKGEMFASLQYQMKTKSKRWDVC